MTLFLVRRNTENQHNPMPHTAANALKALAKGSAAVWTNFQNFLRARKGSITPCSLWSWQTELCLPGSGHDQAALRIVARNCMFLSVAETEQCWVWEGYSLTGSLTVHIPVLPAPVTLAGFAIGTGRHPGVGVQAHPDIPGPAAMKSAATALPLSWEGVSEPPQHPVHASAQPHCSLSCAPAARTPVSSPACTPA